MKAFTQAVLITTLFLLVVLPHQSLCEVTITPFGFAVAIDPGQALIQEIQFANLGENDINFDIFLMDEQWLQVNPQNGEIAADDEMMVEFIFNPPEEEGEFQNFIEVNIQEIGNDNEFQQFEFSVVLANGIDVANLNGGVRDAATNEVLENAIIQIDQFRMTRISSDEGLFSFLNLPLRLYEVTCIVPGYHPFSEEVDVNQDGDFQFNIEMLHSECNPSVNEIETELIVNEIEEIVFEVSNDGNAPLTYITDLVPANFDDEVGWDLIQQIPVGDMLGDSRIQGVVFFDDRFYVAGSNDRDPQIYVLNRDGELLDQFDQFGPGGGYGYKDLAYDGELIWGSGAAEIFGFTPDGELRITLDGPFNPNNNFAWDSDRNLLWVSSTTSNIIGMDREGNRVMELDRQGLRIYGLAYFPDDANGFQLYIFNRESDNDGQIVTKMNPDNGDTMFVCVLEPEGGGTPAGTFITDQYQVGMATFIALSNNGAEDRIDIWHITSTVPWAVLNPREGIIDAQEAQEFTLTLDGTDMLVGEYEFEIRFEHDGFDGETAINVIVTVVPQPDPIQRDIPMNAGWNMVSINLDLLNTNIRVITEPLVINDLLQFVKDGLGRFYVPWLNFDQIRVWNVAEGYLMCVTEECQLPMIGQPIEFDRPIPLRVGWQMVSYFPEQPIEAIVALSGVVDQLRLAKDGSGRFYNPEWGFCNIGDMRQFHGYQLNMAEETDLVYRLEDNIAGNSPESSANRIPELLSVHKVTPENMSLLIICDAAQSGEIGVYSNGSLVGSGVIQEGKCGVAVWGDDPTTDEIDGALPDEGFSLVFADAAGKREIDFEIIEGDGLYQPEDFQAIKLLEVPETPTEFGIVSAYPNPFNSSTSITYNLPESGNINLALFDLNGRQVMNIFSGDIAVGQHSVAIDGALLSSGVYIAELHAGGKVSKKKITLVK